MANITVGMKQLMTRDSDEYCIDMDHMVDRLQDREDNTQVVGVGDLTIRDGWNIANGESLCMDTPVGTAFLNHTSLSQVCGMAGGGMNVINRLSAETASLALNELLTDNGAKSKNYSINVMNNPSSNHRSIRSFYSPRYERVPDVEVAKHFRSLANNYGYEPAGTFAGKRGGLPPIKPECTGLYVGERDIFGFLANERDPVETREDSALYSAIIFGNSECKTSTIYWQHVYYEFICGNHQLWNVGYKNESKRKHVGNPLEVLHLATEAFQKSEADQIAQRDKVYMAVKASQRQAFSDSIKNTRKKLDDYFTKSHADGVMEFLDHPRAYPKNPLSIYGVGQAVTLYSQTHRNADERLAIDRIGGKILSSVDV